MAKSKSKPRKRRKPKGTSTWTRVTNTVGPHMANTFKDTK